MTLTLPSSIQSAQRFNPINFKTSTVRASLIMLIYKVLKCNLLASKYRNNPKYAVLETKYPLKRSAKLYNSISRLVMEEPNRKLMK